MKKKAIVIMPKKTELIGRCGLYCFECPSYTQKAANLASDLREQLRKDQIDKYSDMMAKMPGFKAFENYKQFVALLEAINRIRCKGCRAGGWDGKCKIRKCSMSKKYKGCWQCEIFDSCKTLKVLEDGQSNIHLKNLKKIQKNGTAAFVKSQNR
ncbi:MAG: DUF3795 domain-containing protein [Sedimentisphaerales bacterium]|nr:DUF3795 domain-containing protein [Sedimentisphaerales bacterium]